MKIGVGIVTYQRFDMFKKCVESILRNKPENVDIIVFDDCSVKDRELYDNYFKELNMSKVKCFINKKNSGVGITKNNILEYFYDRDYDYIFTIEDDIIIKDKNVFDKYIKASKKYDIEYLNFAYHGPANANGPILSKEGLELFPACVGAFSLHTRKLIDEIGLHDPEFLNAWEHVEFYYRASLLDLVTPFWYFADIKDSKLYIEEQPGSIDESSIRPRSDWQMNINKGREYFKKKHGIDIFEIKR